MSKPKKSYRKREIGGHTLSPESLMMGFGYDPFMSEGSIKPPIFMTSTFAFKSARDGEALFRRLAARPDDPAQNRRDRMQEPGIGLPVPRNGRPHRRH